MYFWVENCLCYIHFIYFSSIFSSEIFINMERRIWETANNYVWPDTSNGPKPFTSLMIRSTLLPCFLFKVNCILFHHNSHTSYPLIIILRWAEVVILRKITDILHTLLLCSCQIKYKVAVPEWFTACILSTSINVIIWDGASSILSIKDTHCLF